MTRNKNKCLSKHVQRRCKTERKQIKKNTQTTNRIQKTAQKKNHERMILLKEQEILLFLSIRRIFFSFSFLLTLSRPLATHTQTGKVIWNG